MTLISLKEGQLSSRIVSFALWNASTKIQQLRSTQKSRNFISVVGVGFRVFLYETGLKHYIGNLFMPNDVFLPILKSGLAKNFDHGFFRYGKAKMAIFSHFSCFSSHFKLPYF